VAVKVEASYERAALLPESIFKPFGRVASRQQHRGLNSKQPFRHSGLLRTSYWDGRSIVAASSRQTYPIEFDKMYRMKQ
jgi:hypothetical protein